ncbi:protein argonaute-4 [Caerostris extrusa]|uniref:Protein argonaute-4 n=1 Tax=Caerostris extrusa TaxID=172846 RepID=A0AAV4PAR6_CAEEX|nr:protein argonaute-4 [Caerostris extrusa]
MPKTGTFCCESAIRKIASEQGIRIRQPENIEVIDNRRQSVRERSDKRENSEASCRNCSWTCPQCIKDENVVNNCCPSMVKNLCQKINAKTGGINNSLSLARHRHFSHKPIIIIGADADASRSFAPNQTLHRELCVGSMDSTLSLRSDHQRSDGREQKRKLSKSSLNLKEMVLELLKAFYREHQGSEARKNNLSTETAWARGSSTQVRRHEVKCIEKLAGL